MKKKAIIIAVGLGAITAGIVLIFREKKTRRTEKNEPRPIKDGGDEVLREHLKKLRDHFKGPTEK